MRINHRQKQRLGEAAVDSLENDAKAVARALQCGEIPSPEVWVPSALRALRDAGIEGRAETLAVVRFLATHPLGGEALAAPWARCALAASQLAPHERAGRVIQMGALHPFPEALQ